MIAMQIYNENIAILAVIPFHYKAKEKKWYEHKVNTLKRDKTHKWNSHFNLNCSEKCVTTSLPCCACFSEIWLAKVLDLLFPIHLTFSYPPCHSCPLVQ